MNERELVAIMAAILYESCRRDVVEAERIARLLLKVVESEEKPRT